MLIACVMLRGFFLPGSFLLGLWLGYGLLAIWTLMLSYRIIQAGIFFNLWRGEGWTKGRI